MTVPLDVETLAEQLIADLTDILLTSENKRTRRDQSPLNRMSWCSLSIECASAIRYVSQRSGVALTPKTAQLLMDSVGAVYRMAKTQRSFSVTPPPTRPEVVTSYQQLRGQAGWLHLAVQAVIALIDQATEQSTPTEGSKQHSKQAIPLNVEGFQLINQKGETVKMNNQPTHQKPIANPNPLQRRVE